MAAPAGFEPTRRKVTGPASVAVAVNWSSSPSTTDTEAGTVRTGGVFTAWTWIVTVATFESAVPSLTTKVKESGPE